MLVLYIIISLYYITILIHSNIIILLYYYIIIWLYSYIVLLLYYYIIVRLYYDIMRLAYHCIIISLYFWNIILLYSHIIISICVNKHVVVISARRITSKPPYMGPRPRQVHALSGGAAGPGPSQAHGSSATEHVGPARARAHIRWLWGAVPCWDQRTMPCWNQQANAHVLHTLLFLNILPTRS